MIVSSASTADSTESLRVGLDHVLRGIRIRRAESPHRDWYDYLRLFGEVEVPIGTVDPSGDGGDGYHLLRTREHELAVAAVAHEELRPLMAQTVMELVGLGTVWATENDPAGGGLALQLALADPEYCGLYARHLMTNDLTHEVYQSEEIARVITAWGWRFETYPLFWVRMFTPGLFAREDVEWFVGRGLPERMAAPGELGRFLAGSRCLRTEDLRRTHERSPGWVADVFARISPRLDAAFVDALVQGGLATGREDTDPWTITGAEGATGVRRDGSPP